MACGVPFERSYSHFAIVVPTVTLGIWWALRPTEQVRETVVNDVPAILFRDGVLEHASDAILARLPVAIGAHTWQDLHEILVTDYPEFPPSPAYQTDGETVVKGSLATSLYRGTLTPPLLHSTGLSIRPKLPLTPKSSQCYAK